MNKAFTEHLKKQNIKNSFARSKNEFFPNKKHLPLIIKIFFCYENILVSREKFCHVD